MTHALACVVSSMVLAKSASTLSAKKGKRGLSGALTRSAMEKVARLLPLTPNLTPHHRQPWACHSLECHLPEAPRLPLSWVRWVTRCRSMVPSQRCTSQERLLLTILRTMYQCSRPRRLIRGRSMRVRLTLFPLPTNITRRTFPTALCRTLLPISSHIIALICQLLCSHTLSTLGIPTATTPPTPSLHLPVTQASTLPSA